MIWLVIRYGGFIFENLRVSFDRTRFTKFGYGDKLDSKMR